MFIHTTFFIPGKWEQYHGYPLPGPCIARSSADMFVDYEGQTGRRL